MELHRSKYRYVNYRVYYNSPQLLLRLQVHNQKEGIERGVKTHMFRNNNLSHAVSPEKCQLRSGCSRRIHIIFRSLDCYKNLYRRRTVATDEGLQESIMRALWIKRKSLF